MEAKSFKRLDKFLGVVESGPLTSSRLEGGNGPAAQATEVGAQSTVPLTKELLDKAVPAELKERHGVELFFVLCE